MMKRSRQLVNTLVTAMLCWIVFLSSRKVVAAFSPLLPDPDIVSPVKMRLLVIEDHHSLRESLVQYFKEACFVVDSTGTGDEGLWYASEHPYDVILLDLMLPEIDGIEIIGKLRSRQISVFILVISARDGLEDRLEAFNAGADDFLTKPFPMVEALARVHALMRRKYAFKDPVIRITDLTVNPLRRTVERSGQPISLTALEYRLLEYLAFRKGEVVSRTDIWEHVFEDSTGGNSNAVDVYIGYLRKKLNDGHSPNLIHTRRGHGFIIEPA